MVAYGAPRTVDRKSSQVTPAAEIEQEHKDKGLHST